MSPSSFSACTCTWSSQWTLTKSLYHSSKVDALKESGVAITPSSKNSTHPFLCKFIVYWIWVINKISEHFRLCFFSVHQTDELPLLAGRAEHLICTSGTASRCHNSVSRNAPDACGEYSISVYNLWHADNIHKPVGLHESSSMYDHCIGLLNVNSAASVTGGGLGINYIMEKIKVIWL